MKVNWKTLFFGGPIGGLVETKPKNKALSIHDERLWSKLNDLPAVSSAGIIVNKQNAMKFSAVYGCVSLLAGVIAGLPRQIFTDRNGYDEIVPGTRLKPLLNRQPNVLMTAFVFWETMLFDLFLSGNCYALIYRTKMGDPKEVLWVPSDSIEPKMNAAKTRLEYHVVLPNRTVKFDQDDIVHIPCIGWDGTKGMSPIKAAHEGIGLGLAGEKYNAHFFTNSITSDIAITYPNKLDQTAKEELEDYLKERYSNIENLRKPFIGTEGADVKKLGMSASDAQMIESRDYQVEDICRFYGVPPWMVGAMKKTTSWGTGLGEQVLGFIKFTLTKHLIRIEQEVDRKLVRRPDRFCKHNLDALQRADIKTRNDAYKVSLGGNQAPGYMTKNEVRAKEQLPPDPDPESNKLYTPPVKADKNVEKEENPHD